MTENEKLLDAAKYGNVSDVKCLVKAGANVHAVNKKGGTPLHLAAIFDKNEIAKRLIADGANVHAVDDFGHTPLDLATYYGSTSIKNLLENHGATEQVN